MSKQQRRADFWAKLEKRLIDEVIVDFGPRLSVMQAKAIVSIVGDSLDKEKQGHKMLAC